MSEISKEQESKTIELRDSLAKDFDEEKAREFASEHVDMKWYADFMLLYEMVTSSEYSISSKTKLIIAGTLAYIVLPVDVIPDFIPIVGWLDDIFVLGLATRTLSDEIAEFKDYKARKDG